MPKLIFFILLVVVCCVVVIGLWTFAPSFQNQQTKLPQPAVLPSSKMNTNFSLRPPNLNYSLSGYVLVKEYAGQQGIGMKSLYSLQHWVRDISLPMKIVEPFIQDSFLGIYRKSFQELRFSDLFDLENFNRVSQMEGVTELIPWKTYVTCSSGRAVLVRIKRAASFTPPEVVWEAQPGSSECWPNGYKYTITVNKGHLCYVRVVDYIHISGNASTFPGREIVSIFLAGLMSVDLVFDLWSAAWHIPGVPIWLRSVSPFLSSGKNGSVSLTHKLRDSAKISLDVKNYQKQFLTRFADLSYVAVMLRSEYILMDLSHANDKRLNLQGFLDETVNVTTTVMTELGIDDVFATADVGKYGSNSLKKRTVGPRVEEQVKQTVEKLYKDMWTFQQWEESFLQVTSHVKDRGYIAAVQRGIAIQASCLILLGGGSFQELTLKMYANRIEPQKRCIHFVGLNLVKRLYKLKDI